MTAPDPPRARLSAAWSPLVDQPLNLTDDETAHLYADVPGQAELAVAGGFLAADPAYDAGLFDGGEL